MAILFLGYINLNSNLYIHLTDESIHPELCMIIDHCVNPFIIQNAVYIITNMYKLSTEIVPLGISPIVRIARTSNKLHT